MKPLKCFEQELSPAALDRAASLFRHTMLGHPALSLDHLVRIIPKLPKNLVFHSSGRPDGGGDSGRAHAPERQLRETLERLRTADACIVVRQPETDASFMPLMKDLAHDVSRMVVEAGIPGGIDEAMLQLFIASPNSVAPFRIERHSTLLLQFHGSQQVSVYPPWDERVVSDEDVEQFFARTGRRPCRRPQAESLGTHFPFAPGQALHIPFAAGHQMRHDGDDVSISLSIAFNTVQTRRLMRALSFNHHARPWLKRIGVTPRRVALDAPGVAGKSTLWRMGNRVLHPAG